MIARASIVLVAVALSACSSSSAVKAPDAGLPQDAGTDAGNPVDGGQAVIGQSWVWVWNDYTQSLSAVHDNASAFTHVMPALYDVNYAYNSGTPEFSNGSDDFDGKTAQQICDAVHADGLKCLPLIYGGTANGGVDTGIINILTDSTIQTAFINALVSEGQTKGYDGWNIDWEPDTNQMVTYSAYGAQLTSFLAAAKSALNAHGMLLTLDTATFYIRQSNCSGGDGFVDLTALDGRVDYVLEEAYEPPLWIGAGAAPIACPATLPNPLDCQEDVLTELELMCTYVPNAIAVIGLEAPEQNGIAAEAVTTVKSFGYHRAAIWPDSNTDGSGNQYLFLDEEGITPASDSWYGLLRSFVKPAP